MKDIFKKKLDVLEQEHTQLLKNIESTFVWPKERPKKKRRKGRK